MRESLRTGKANRKMKGIEMKIIINFCMTHMTFSGFAGRVQIFSDYWPTSMCVIFVTFAMNGFSVWLFNVALKCSIRLRTLCARHLIRAHG